jgi:hypothetical protein
MALINFDKMNLSIDGQIFSILRKIRHFYEFNVFNLESDHKHTTCDTIYDMSILLSYFDH